MVLIYDGMSQDPRVGRLSDAAFGFWMGAIGTCNTRRRDTLAVDELREALDEVHRGAGRSYDVGACLQELLDAELAQRLPHDHVRMLARLDLWAFDDEAEAQVDLRSFGDET